MRLKPIEHPKSLVLKVVYFLSKKQFGKVLAPLRIIYARSIPILMVSNKIINTDKKLYLSHELRTLIRYFVSNLNDCKFCSNVQHYYAVKENMEVKKIIEVLNFRNNPNFSEKEKSLLAYVEEVTLNKQSGEETFEQLKRHFNEREIVEITWVNATENYFNLMAKPLGLSSDDLKSKK